MNWIPRLSLIAVAALYVACDVLWLGLSNASSASMGSQQEALKTLALVIAAIVFVSHAAIVAHRSSSRWISRTAGIAGGAVLLGFALIVAVSAVWYRGQFFHDSSVAHRLPGLTAMALILAAASGVAAVVVGKLARLLRTSSGAGAGPV